MLKQYENIIWVDTSIRFKNINQLNSWMKLSKDTGFLAHHLGGNFTCFTDNRMSKWFGSDNKEFNSLEGLQANFFIFHRNLVLELMMKSWVTCALDESCIAPKGSHIYGSIKNWGLTGPDCHQCGCHRFDQAAITIISSFFFGHPVNYQQYRSSYSSILRDSNVYTCDRRDIAKYVWDQFDNPFKYFSKVFFK